MNNIAIGILITILTVGPLEVLKSIEKRLAASLTLVGIAFIYLGFVWGQWLLVATVSTFVMGFFALAYIGYKKNFVWIIVGLVLHGLWDIIFPFFSSSVPGGYDIFCLTVDILLAVYFFIRVER